jgi:hypothetical protein
MMALGISGVILLLVLGWFAYTTFFKKRGSSSSSQWTVYGTDGCGWTRKQLKEMDDKGVSYTYVNCETGDCGGISSYPTLKSDSGETKVGFTTF